MANMAQAVRMALHYGETHLGVTDVLGEDVLVTRKGAVRAGAGELGIIPGSMGARSYIVRGKGNPQSFCSCSHGAGRAMSRTAALKDGAGRKIDRELEHKGVIAMASSRNGLAEEQPKAYKNVDDVVDVVHEADLSRRVARMRPLGVIKG